MAIRKRKKTKTTKKTKTIKKTKIKTKAQTKKDIEKKIAQLEAKLTALSGVPVAPPSRKTKAPTPKLTKPKQVSVSNLPENAGIMSWQPRPTELGVQIPTFLAPPEIETKAAPPPPPPPPKPADKVLPKQFKPQAPPPPPPPPKPADKVLPKQFKPQAPPPPPPPPKKAEPTPPPPVTLSQAIEKAWQNYPMTNTHDYKAKTPGYSPNPNRYYGRRSAPAGTAPTQDWNLQKEKVTGFTAPSNQYFATRARLSYHPSDKTFTGYGLQIAGATAQEQTQKPSSKGTLPKGF